MEGVRTVRLVAALAVAALLAGGWMMSAPLDDIAEGDGDEGTRYRPHWPQRKIPGKRGSRNSGGVRRRKTPNPPFQRG